MPYKVRDPNDREPREDISNKKKTRKILKTFLRDILRFGSRAGPRNKVLGLIGICLLPFLPLTASKAISNINVNIDISRPFDQKANIQLSAKESQRGDRNTPTSQNTINPITRLAAFRKDDPLDKPYDAESRFESLRNRLDHAISYLSDLPLGKSPQTRRINFSNIRDFGQGILWEVSNDTLDLMKVAKKPYTKGISDIDVLFEGMPGSVLASKLSNLLFDLKHNLEKVKLLGVLDPEEVEVIQNTLMEEILALAAVGKPNFSNF